MLDLQWVSDIGSRDVQSKITADDTILKLKLKMLEILNRPGSMCEEQRED